MMTTTDAFVNFMSPTKRNMNGGMPTSAGTPFKLGSSFSYASLSPSTGGSGGGDAGNSNPAPNNGTVLLHLLPLPYIELSREPDREEEVEDEDGNVKKVPIPGKINKLILPRIGGGTSSSNIWTGGRNHPNYRRGTNTRVMCYRPSDHDLFDSMEFIVHSLKIPRSMQGFPLEKEIILCFYSHNHLSTPRIRSM